MNTRAVFALSLITFTGSASAEIHRVTQTGAREDFSVAEFNNAANWGSGSGKISPGDTVYFSGTITSQVTPKGSGTAGDQITIDGWEGGTCNPVENDGCSQATLVDFVHHPCGAFCLEDVEYLVVQDFRITNRDVDKGEGIRTRDSSGSNNGACNNIIMRRNHIYDIWDRAAHIDFCSDITFGGARGDGNLVQNSGRHEQDDQFLTIIGSTDIIVSYNKMGHDLDFDVWLSQNIVTIHNSDDILIENNAIFNPQGGACVTAKEHGNTDVIIRFNKFYDGLHLDNGQDDLGPTTSWDTERAYIYGNYIFNMEKGAGIMKQSRNIYYWANIFDSSPGGGLYVSRATASPLYSVSDGHIYNNVFYNNGHNDAIERNNYGLYLMDMISENALTFRNNIFLKEGEGAPYYEVACIFENSLDYVDFDYNTYFYDSSNPVQWKWGGIQDRYVKSMAEIQALGHEAHVSVNDPGILDPENHDFTLADGADSINTGLSLGNSPIATINIQGVDYEMNLADALDPVRTDWTQTPPIVYTLNQNDYGAWERGAYVYRKSVPLPPTNLKITAPQW